MVLAGDRVGLVRGLNGLGREGAGMVLLGGERWFWWGSSGFGYPSRALVVSVDG